MKKKSEREEKTRKNAVETFLSLSLSLSFFLFLSIFFTRVRGNGDTVFVTASDESNDNYSRCAKFNAL